MTGDAGVVENEHSVWPVAGGQPHGMGGQFWRRDGCEPAVGVIEQGDGGRGKLSAGLLQLRFASPVQIGVVLVQRGRLAVGVAENVRGSTRGRHEADDRAQPEGLVVGMSDDHQYFRPSRQQPPGTDAPCWAVPSCPGT
jgi:hypothetical protein